MNGPGHFAHFARATAESAGRPLAFTAALTVVLIWAVTGPMFHFSDTWQLVINTGTTIVTFLMVFLIQNTQNRDSHAMQLKMDELIRAVHGAHNIMLNLEDLSDEELALVHKRYTTLANQARQQLERGKKDTNAPDIKDVVQDVRKHIRGE